MIVALNYNLEYRRVKRFLNRVQYSDKSMLKYKDVVIQSNVFEADGYISIQYSIRVTVIDNIEGFTHLELIKTNFLETIEEAKKEFKNLIYEEINPDI